MDRQTISDKTFALIADTLKIKKEDIKIDSNLADLCADSIQLFELILSFEKEFGIEAKYDDLIQILTVQDIIEYLEGHLPKASP